MITIIPRIGIRCVARSNEEEPTRRAYTPPSDILAGMSIP
jgi:hypothetical protein